MEEKIEDESRQRYYADRTDLDRRIYAVAWNTIKYYIDNIFPEAYEIIKQKVLFSGDIEYKIKKLTWESNLTHKIYPLIDSTHETFVSSLLDTELSPVVIERVPWAEELKKEAQHFYDWSESMSKIGDTEELIQREGSLLWTSYAIFGSKENLVYNNPKVWKPVDEWDWEVTEFPNADHVSFFELFCEPWCSDFDKSRYKIRRRLMTLNQMKEEYVYIDFEQTKETIQDWDVELSDFIERTAWHCLYTRDFNRIRQIKDYEYQYRKNLVEKNLDWNLFDVGLYEDMFKMVIDEWGIHEVIEYWSWESLIVMVNGYVIYDGDNPYGNVDPFACVVYEEIPGSYRWRGIWQKLMPLQTEANMLFSAVNNGIKMHLFPDYAITKWSLKDTNWTDISQLKRIWWKVYEIPQGNTLTSEPFKAIHFVEKDVLSLANRRLLEIKAEAMEIIGTNSYTQWWQGKIERSASAVSQRVAATRSRLNGIVKSLNRFRQKSFYVRLYIASIYFPDELMVRLIDSDNNASFLKISPSEILNKFEILIDRETAVSIRRSEAVSNTIQTLNALTPYMVDQNWLPTLDIRDTIDKMLKESMLWDVKILNEEWIKEWIDLKMNIEKYMAEKGVPQGWMAQGWQAGGSIDNQLREISQNMPDRWVQATPEQLRELWMS